MFNVQLLKRSHTQHVHLLLCEVTPVTTTNILLGKAGKEHAIQLDNLITKALEDTTYDAVTSAVDFDTNLLTVGLAGILDSICMNLAIL